MPRKAKFVPKKKKTLTPEPNWTKLRKAKTEEDMIAAWKDCEDYVHYEITDKELIHSARRWVELQSGWGLTDEVSAIPTSYLLSYAKNAWKARMLGFLPSGVEKSLTNGLKPLIQRAYELKARELDGEPIFPVNEDDSLHPTKVKKWLKTWKEFLTASKAMEDSKDTKQRMEFQIAKTYVYNMSMYLRTGMWLDSHYGENREFKMMTVCKALAYHKDGTVNRTVGTYYPDIGAVWKREDEHYADR